MTIYSDKIQVIRFECEQDFLLILNGES